MKVRFYFDVLIPKEKLKEMSESMDVTLFGHDEIQQRINDAVSCDDLPLQWMELKD